MHDTASKRAASSKACALARLIRPKQWIKNGLVLAPLMFTGEFTRPAPVIQALVAVVLFCLASSATYILNDICDIERDKRHPVKSRTRPLAAGQIAVNTAFILLAVIYVCLIAGWFFAPNVILVIVGYLALNVAYTLVLKHQPVLDIFTIAVGFVLRVWAGAVALDVPVSGWMFVTTLSLALYLAAVKRGQELATSGVQGRKVLERYSKPLVDRYAEMSATCALVFYSMFVMSAKPQLVITVPVVLFGLFRYWYVVEMLEGGESPTDALYDDWPLILTVLVWVAACMWALWPV
jgi:4-hydroxybenzoate polyprenyltransferase